MALSKIAFNGAAIVAGLDPEERDALAALALERLAATWLAVDAEATGDHVLRRAAEHAGELVTEALDDFFQETASFRLLRDSQGAAQIPSIVGAVCHACGCSHHDPCPRGCGWHSETLCTACHHDPVETQERIDRERAARLQAVANMGENDLAF